MSLTPNGSPVEAAGTEQIVELYSYALVLTRSRSEANLLQETFCTSEMDSGTNPRAAAEAVSLASNLEKESIMSSTSLKLQPLELLPGDLLRPPRRF